MRVDRIVTHKAVGCGRKVVDIFGGELVRHPSQGHLQNLVPVLGGRNA
jgi:hypothetical protein